MSRKTYKQVKKDPFLWCL